jgi:hypothetical protein
LITAPAAVGKSTAASYMGNHLKAPVLDLSTLQVGDATLEGALSKALGFRAAAEFAQDMSEGHASLIVDALDEAEVRSGQANYSAFLRGVAHTASQISNRAGLILFSRAESIRALKSLFDERRIQFSHYEILPFDRSRAEEYLDKRISGIYERQRRELVHHRHATPYQEVRDKLLAMLASAIDQGREGLWESRDVREFLGYAPVLDVASEFLAVENFAALSRSLSNNEKGANKGLGHWNLVARVIDQLLDRERKKFVEQFTLTADYLALDGSQYKNILYTAEEQCTRLLDYVENLQLSLEVPVALPEKIRDSYEVAANTQLANHPFLRGAGWFNVIFRDYVTARSLISPMASPSSTNAIRKSLLSSNWKHSPMFGYFLFSLSKSGEKDISACHSEEIGALYESFKSMCESQDELHTSVGRQRDHLIASFAVLRSGNTDPIIGPLQFRCHPASLSIAFPRELRNANIWQVPEIILGGDQGSFKCGPEVFVTCTDLLVTARELQVYVAAEESPVVIDTKSLTSENIQVQAERNVLFIHGQDLGYPWSKYATSFNINLAQSRAREAYALYLELRRIVLRFKDAKRGEGAVYEPLMDNLVISGNWRARQVLNYLEEVGCVERRNKMYLLKFAEFSKWNISRSQLRDLEFTEASAALARQLVNYVEKSEST